MQKSSLFTSFKPRLFKPLLFAVLVGIAPAFGALPAQASQLAVATQAANININTADADTLAQHLDGVGRNRALAIVQYRDTYGPFFTVDDLLEVKGVGQSVVDHNRDRITLE